MTKIPSVIVGRDDSARRCFTLRRPWIPARAGMTECAEWQGVRARIPEHVGIPVFGGPITSADLRDAVDGVPYYQNAEPARYIGRHCDFKFILTK